MRISSFAGVLLLAGLAAQADVTTFGDGLGGGFVTPSYTEGNFLFTVGSGTQDCIEGCGNPDCAFSLGCNTAPNVGNRMHVTLVGGGLFTFTPFDFKSNRLPPDLMRFHGNVDPVITQQLLNLGANGPLVFAPTATGFTAPIDRLRLDFSAVGNDSHPLDNLVLISRSAWRGAPLASSAVARPPVSSSVRLEPGAWNALTGSCTRVGRSRVTSSPLRRRRRPRRSGRPVAKSPR